MYYKIWWFNKGETNCRDNKTEEMTIYQTPIDGEVTFCVLN